MSKCEHEYYLCEKQGYESWLSCSKCGGEFNIIDSIETLQAKIAELEKANEWIEAHIFPHDLKKLERTECCVELYSVAAGHPDFGKTVQVFVRKPITPPKEVEI